MRIRQIGDPILRKVSRPLSVDEISSTEVSELVNLMKAVLDGTKGISAENGNALSAPQVGSLVRLILLRIEGEFVVMINPEYQASSERMFEFEEECFSLYDQRATLRRWRNIDVEFLDVDGLRHQLSCTGELAGLIQHEVDHLNGVLFVDHVETQGAELASIDALLCEQPERLAQVRAMIDYMKG